MERLPEFIGNHALLVAALVAVLALILITEWRRAKRNFKQVSPQEAAQLSNHEDALFLDVREDSEYRQGHLLESKHIPLGRLQERMGELEKFRGRPIIAYCRSGQRSAQACEILGTNGFEPLYNLRGGLMSWQGEGMPVTK